MAVRDMLLTDARDGMRQTPEDLVIALLVMAPFALTLAVFVCWILPLPSAVAIGLFLVALVAGGLWNAGWRARTGA